MQPSLKELQAASNLLRGAQSSCESVRDLFFSAHRADASARLSAIASRLDYEREIIGRLIAELSSGVPSPDRHWPQQRLHAGTR